MWSLEHRIGNVSKESSATLDVRRNNRRSTSTPLNKAKLSDSHVVQPFLTKHTTRLPSQRTADLRCSHPKRKKFSPRVVAFLSETVFGFLSGTDVESAPSGIVKRTKYIIKNRFHLPQEESVQTVPQAAQIDEVIGAHQSTRTMEHARR